MRLNNILATAFAGLVFLFVLLTMFLPMHTQGGGGGSIDVTVWGVDFSAGEFSEHTSWFDDEVKDEDGIHGLRASGILMTIAVVGSFMALLFGVLNILGNNYRQMAMMASLATVVFAMAALISYSVGFDQLSDGDSGMDHGAAFGLAITGIILSAFAGAIMLLKTNLQTLLVAPLEAE